MIKSVFTVFPAVDLRQGKVVRLVQGDPARKTVYSEDPAAMARRWLDAGAGWLHVVNLDGALSTTWEDTNNKANLVALRAILQTTAAYPSARVQFGGGVRSLDDVTHLLSAGVARVILGTAAIRSPEFVASGIQQYGASRVCVGIDARDGEVKIDGWQSGTGIRAEMLAMQMTALGVETIIFTNIARDGTGTGVDIPATLRIAAACSSSAEAVTLSARSSVAKHLNVIASGGINSLQDVRDVKQAGLSGVIVGKALYDGRFTLQEAFAC